MTVLQNRGVVSAFANAYFQATGTSIVGISCSQTNTQISEWLPGSNKWNDLLERISSCEYFLENSSEYSIGHVYMLFCQGAANALDSYETYYSDLNYFVDSVLTQTDVEKIFVIRIGNKETEPDRNDIVMQVQNDLCTAREDMVLVSTRFAEFGNFEMMKDSQYYTQVEYNLVGTEAGLNTAYYTLTGVQPRIYDYEFNDYYE